MSAEKGQFPPPPDNIAGELTQPDRIAVVVNEAVIQTNRRRQLDSATTDQLSAYLVEMLHLANESCGGSWNGVRAVREPERKRIKLYKGNENLPVNINYGIHSINTDSNIRLNEISKAFTSGFMLSFSMLQMNVDTYEAYKAKLKLSKGHANVRAGQQRTTKQTPRESSINPR